MESLDFFIDSTRNNIYADRPNFMLPQNGQNRIRIISGPVDSQGSYRVPHTDPPKTMVRHEMVVIDRKDNQVKILAAGKALFRMIAECVRKYGNPINYDIQIMRSYDMFNMYRVFPLTKTPLSEEDMDNIAVANIPDYFKIKKDYSKLLVVGTKFRITNRSVTITKNCVTKNIFGKEFPPCEIVKADEKLVVIGRKDWDFTVPVLKKDACDKFESGAWVLAAEVPEPSSEPVFCERHRRFMPGNMICCPESGGNIISF